MTFTVGLSADEGGVVPTYVDMYISSGSPDYFLSSPAQTDGSEYYYANGSVVKLDLQKLNSYLAADAGLQFVFASEGVWQPTGSNGYLTFSNIEFA